MKTVLPNSSSQLLLQRNYWVFDLDGTLTKPVHNFPYIREQLEIPAAEDILHFISKQAPGRRQYLIDKLDEFEFFYAEKVEPAEGVVELLSHLVNHGAQLAVLTRNTREVALCSLKTIGIDGMFDPALVLGRYDAEPKPNPDGLHKILQQWQRLPSSAVMVGDFLHDLAVGRAAGVATVHVAVDPMQSWPEYTDLRVGSLTQLRDMIKR